MLDYVQNKHKLNGKLFQDSTNKIFVTDNTGTIVYRKYFNGINERQNSLNEFIIEEEKRNEQAKDRNK
ncbi:MAG: hypothetical protein WBV81_06770 [Ignavibacteriaceae bacterium]